MDRPYDDNETLGMTDVDDGTPIPKGTGANTGTAPNGGARYRDKTATKDETFASGDQAAASANEPSWLNDLRIRTRQDPIASIAIAGAVGLLAGLILRR